jgi:hypothetical protein
LEMIFWQLLNGNRPREKIRILCSNVVARND